MSPGCGRTLRRSPGYAAIYPAATPACCKPQPVASKKLEAHARTNETPHLGGVPLGMAGPHKDHVIVLCNDTVCENDTLAFLDTGLLASVLAPEMDMCIAVGVNVKSAAAMA